MKKNGMVILRITIFLCVLFSLFEVCSFLLQPRENRKEEGIRNIRTYGFLCEPEQTIDVLVLGDSLASYSCYGMDIWREYGFPVYDCGFGNQNPAETVELMYQFCERQSPKVILWEINQLFAEYTILDVIANTAERTFPVLRYHDHWKSLRLEDVIRGPVFQEKCISKGARPTIAVKPAEIPEGGYMIPTEEIREVPFLSYQNVKEVQKFCQQKGIALYLYSAPSSAYWNYAKHNGAVKMAQELGLEFLDMNLMEEEIPIDWNQDTSDGGYHMNITGAAKVTSYLGKFFSDSGYLADRRQDSQCAFWNTELKEYDLYLRNELKD